MTKRLSESVLRSIGSQSFSVRLKATRYAAVTAGVVGSGRETHAGRPCDVPDMDAPWSPTTTSPPSVNQAKTLGQKCFSGSPVAGAKPLHPEPPSCFLGLIPVFSLFAAAGGRLPSGLNATAKKRQTLERMQFRPGRYLPHLHAAGPLREPVISARRCQQPAIWAEGHVIDVSLEALECQDSLRCLAPPQQVAHSQPRLSGSQVSRMPGASVCPASNSRSANAKRST